MIGKYAHSGDFALLPTFEIGKAEAVLVEDVVTGEGLADLL